MDERNKTVDFFKGIAIISIIFSHTIGFLQNASERTIKIAEMGFANIPQEIFYSGLLLFLVISGYYTVTERGFFKNFSKRFLQIFFVVIAAAVILPSIVFFFMKITNVPCDIQTLGEYIKSILLGEEFYFSINGGFVPMYDNYFAVCGPFYFLEVMIVSFALFFSISKFVTKNMKTAAISIIILVVLSGILNYYDVHLPWYIDMAPMGAAFMIAGACFKKFEIFEKINDGTLFSTKNGKIAFAGILIGAILLACFFPTGRNFVYSEYGQYEFFSAFTFFAGMLMSGLVLLVLCHYGNMIPKLSDFVRSVGNYTLYILVFHVFFVKLLAVFFIPRSIDPTLEVPFPNIFVAILFALISIVLSYFASIYLKKLIDKISSKS